MRIRSEKQRLTVRRTLRAVMRKLEEALRLSRARESNAGRRPALHVIDGSKGHA